MKLAILSDTHQGSRNDSKVYDDYFRKFYTEVFFPELAKRGIKTVIHGGDAFERRKYISFVTLKSAREYLYDPMRDAGITMHLIAGNHDVTYRNTNSVNSPELLLADYPNVIKYTGPEEVEIEGIKVALMPWINAENVSESMNLMKTTTARLCVGHFDIQGFAMHAGDSGSTDGLNPEMFAQFDRVISGHFHHRSTKGNITYVGSPYQSTWSDWNDPRGFHIIDTETLELEFVENPFTIFEKVYYDDSEKDWNVEPVDHLSGKNVKLVVTRKTDFYQFEQFVNRLEKQNLVDLKIIEDLSEFESEVADDSVSLESTTTLLDSYVDALETVLDKAKIKGSLSRLYTEAQQIAE